MKSLFADMRDCHSATASFVTILKSRGFDDAKVVGCSAIIGSQDTIISLTGEIDFAAAAAHSIVTAKGCLIDPTAGQFRGPGVKIPDYLVLRGIADPMLEANRRWLERKSDELFRFSQKDGANDFLVAYIPTDPCFTIR